MTFPANTTVAGTEAASGTDEAARQLEAYFLRRVLAEVKTGSDSLLSGGFAGETFQSMLNEALADSMAAAGGLGISQMIVGQLEGDPRGAAIGPRDYRPVGGSTGGMVAPVQGTETSGFGMRVHPISGARKLHAGLDIAATAGTEVRAAAAGTVKSAGRSGGYGNLVVLTHAGGIETRYAHLSKIDVKVGQRLSPGARLGAVGSTGASTGPHLHFEVRKDGVALDPKSRLAASLTPQK